MLYLLIAFCVRQDSTQAGFRTPCCRHAVAPGKGAFLIRLGFGGIVRYGINNDKDTHASGFYIMAMIVMAGSAPALAGSRCSVKSQVCKELPTLDPKPLKPL